MKYLIFNFVLFFVITDSYSQVDISVFNDISGTWSATYSTGVQDYMNKETLTCKWIHNHNFFLMEISGEVVDHSEYNFSSTLIFTLDDKGNLKGWGFDENGYRNIVNYKGKVVEDESLVLEGKNPDFTYKQIFELKQSKLVNKREFKRDGNSATKFVVIYTKK